MYRFEALAMYCDPAVERSVRSFDRSGSHIHFAILTVAVTQAITEIEVRLIVVCRADRLHGAVLIVFMNGIQPSPRLLLGRALAGEVLPCGLSCRELAACWNVAHDRGAGFDQ